MSLPHKCYSFLSILCTLIFIPGLLQAEPDPAEGQQIFQAECQQCHAIGAEVIGPDLANVNERRDESWLIPFIRNSQQLIREGDELANELFEEYNQMVMPAVDLSDREIRSVLAYIEQETQALAEAEPENDEAAPAAPGTADDPGFYGIPVDTISTFLWVLAVVLIILLLILYRVHSSVKSLLWKKLHPGEPVPDSWTTVFRREVFEPGMVVMKRVNPVFGVLSVKAVVVIIIIVILYDRGQYVGSQEGYAPEQPVPFDHQLHAGTHEIDCQYCHTGVEFGKHADIPSLNVCMNCHGGIGQDNPDVQKVVEAYEAGEPIEWVRIHNIADHAYFNHAQHVVAGGLECQTCHGPVEEMPKLGQVNNMTMGWCIDCHRETEVDLTNQYYHESFDFIKDHESLTVAEMGGLDCSSCHY